MSPGFLEGSVDALHAVGERLAGGLRIGLVNNMPDPALRRTEQQFRSLLATASGGAAIDFCFATLPSIARSGWAAQHIADSYQDVDQMLESEPDAVIITGAEPRAPELSDEPYWKAFTGLLDRLEQARLPTAFCCLAAHAAVLHRDGIRRRRLPVKCFGIFEHSVAVDHPFSRDAERFHLLPHSRWNEVSEVDLTAHGYVPLTRADGIGVGAFARPSDRNLFFQGHPEYSGTSLLREYRRDVRRFLYRERESYPEMPVNGLSSAGQAVFQAFEEQAVRNRTEALFAEFPAFAMADARAIPWRHAGAQIYRGWLTSAVAALSCTSPAPEDLSGT